MKIHPSSFVDKSVELGADVEIGPFCLVKGKTKIGSGTKLMSHVVIGSDSTAVEIGKNNFFHPGAIIGGPPQDLKYNGEQTQVIIGDNNSFREFCTVNAGTVNGGGITRIGDKGLFMAYVHIAHDCQIGTDIVIANSCQLAGHVHIDDHAKIGGVCCFNQFVRVGKYAYIAGDSSVNKDILPFAIAQGNYAKMRSFNQIGMERNGFTKEQVAAVKTVTRWLLMGSNTQVENLEKMKTEFASVDVIQDMVKFIESSERGLAI